MKGQTKSNRKIIIILSITAFLFILLFMFYEVNSRNAGFFLPRRLTKIITFLVVSLATSYAAISFQTMTNNKILTPSVMGLENLYLLLQTIIVFFFQSRAIEMLEGLGNYFISVALMVGCSLLLFTLLFKKNNGGIYLLLLAGIVFSSLFSGIASFMQVLLDPNEFTLLQGKMFASFSSINSDLLIYSILIIVFVFLFVIKDSYILDVMALGRENAINLGINHEKILMKNFIVISVLTAVTTALVGPVSFLGIIIASLSRSLFKTYRHNIRIIGGTLISLIFLCFSVFLVEHVFNFSTTVSVIINIIGGSYFIILLLKEARI